MEHLLLQKLSNSLLTAVGHAGGGVDHDAFFDGGFPSPSGKAVLFRKSLMIPCGYAAAPNGGIAA